jgi:exodeoxyribonuclease-3
MWASPALASHLAAHQVLEPCRSWERPSDHVPLICEIDV